MAIILTLSDGSTETLLGFGGGYGDSDPDLSHRELTQIARERLGDEFADLMERNKEDMTDHGDIDMGGDDWEKIADEYYQMLHGANDELESLIKIIENAARLNKQTVLKSVKHIRDSIHKNL